MLSPACLATLAALCGLATASLAQPAPTPSFNLFLPITGEPGVTFAGVRDLSDDGSVVVGLYATNNQIARSFSYTPGSGLTTLPPTTSGPAPLRRVSGDGLTSLGAVVLNPAVGLTAVTWTPGGGYVPLPAFFPGSTSSAANSSSDDASWIVGNSFPAGSIAAQPIRWNSQRVPSVLSAPSSENGAEALFVSNNGSLVAGRTLAQSSDLVRGFVWREGGGSEFLASGPGGQATTVEDMSGDGRWISGTSLDMNGVRVATRWDTQTNTIQPLGQLPGFFTSQASSISDDGNVVVGEVTQGFAFTAFVWTPQTGMTLLKDYLLAANVPFTDTLIDVRRAVVSGDGLSFAGNVTLQRPDGTNYAGSFVARIPTPGTACVVLGGLLIGTRRRR